MNGGGLGIWAKWHKWDRFPWRLEGRALPPGLSLPELSASLCFCSSVLCLSARIAFMQLQAPWGQRLSLVYSLLYPQKRSLVITAWWIRVYELATSLTVQWLGFHLLVQGVYSWFLLGKPSKIPHASWPKNQKTWNRSNILTNSIKTFLMVHIKKKTQLRKMNIWA